MMSFECLFYSLSYVRSSWSYNTKLDATGTGIAGMDGVGLATERHVLMGFEDSLAAPLIDTYPDSYRCGMIPRKLFRSNISYIVWCSACPRNVQ